MIQITDETILKPLSKDHAQEIFDILNEEREYMRVWLPFVDKTIKVANTQAAVDSLVESIDKQYCIYHKNAFVGLIGFKATDIENRKTEIGYWLSQSVQGKGIMRQSVRKLIEIAFNEFNLNRIQIKVAVENDRSRQIPEKLGFVLEGIERDGELLVDDVFTDIVVYSLLKNEFE